MGRTRGKVLTRASAFYRRYRGMLASTVQFDPMFVYIGLGIAATIAVGRFLLSWAVGFS